MGGATQEGPERLMLHNQIISRLLASEILYVSGQQCQVHSNQLGRIEMRNVG